MADRAGTSGTELVSLFHHSWHFQCLAPDRAGSLAGRYHPPTGYGTGSPRSSLSKICRCFYAGSDQSLCHWGKEFCGFRAGRQVREDIRSVLLNKLSRLGPLAVSTRPAGSWSSVVVEQVEELQEFVAHYLPQMVLAAAVPLIMLVVIFPQSWIVGMVFLVTAPLIPMFMIFVGGKAAEANRRNFKALSRLGGFFLDRIQGLETLRLFQRTDHAVSQLDDASEHFRTKTMSVLRLAFLSSTILEFFASIAIALIAVYLGMNFLGHISIGGQVSLYTGLFLLLLAPDFYQPLRELGTYYHAKAKAIGAAEDIIAVMEQQEPAEHQGQKLLPKSRTFSLEAKNISVFLARQKDLCWIISVFIFPGGTCRYYWQQWCR